MFNNPPQEWLLKATKKILDKPTLTENKKNAEQN
jgi:hypothetical protein